MNPYYEEALDAMFDDPEGDPEEAENVRLGLGYHHDDHDEAPGTGPLDRVTAWGSFHHVGDRG